ncbi:MAG: hypothetical protein O7E54_05470 [Planctomycetota bacterium]|nr:hypothetical protein [Planctomycetota bacterium]
MRSTTILLGLILLSGCTADTGGSGSESGTAALRGVVFQVDGQTQDRSGVQIRLIETGASVTTDRDGRFSFASVPAGRITLGVGQSLVAVPHERGDDDEGDDADDDDADDDDDDDDADDDADDDECDVEVRCSVSDGHIDEISIVRCDDREAKARLVRSPDSPDPDVEGKVEVEADDGEEEFEIEAEHLDPGTIVEFFLADPDDADNFRSIGTVAADAGGEAELEFEDGAALPLGAASLDELADFLIEVRLAATGETLLTGTVPALPDFTTAVDDFVGEGDRARGRSRLTAHVAGLEGKVEIRSRPEKGRERFKMEAENLAEGTEVAFLIEDPDDAGTFVQLASVAADATGEAEIDTNDGLPLPLGVTRVSELVGLEVRVIRDDGSEELLLSGTVPELVAD